MSSTNRGGKRANNDFYPTPAWCVHRLLEACPLPGGTWLEPAAGDGAIILAVNKVRRVKWWANEPDRSRPRPLGVRQCNITHEDFLRIPTANINADVIITNPPFALAQEFVEHALQATYWHKKPKWPEMGERDHAVIVMLLRLNFLGGGKRGELLRQDTPSVYVLPNRPSFTPDGKTDSCDYAWFVWGLGDGARLTILNDTPKGER